MMKATGIVRKVDELGRVVLPMSLRKDLNINERDPIEMYVDEDGAIVLKKYEAQCVFCGDTEEVADFKRKDICKVCRAEFKGNN